MPRVQPTAAACVLLRPLLTGPARRGRVVGVCSHAAYVRLESGEGAPDGPLLAILDGTATPLPIGAQLAGALPPGVTPGLAAVAGGGCVRLARLAIITVGRWVAPARVPLPGRATVETGQRPASVSSGELRGWAAVLPGEVDAALRRAAVLLRAGRGAGAGRQLTDVLGLGPGSTPAADDAVAGVLLAARALADAPERRTALAEAARQVRASAPARTTPLSAALLGCAASGYATPAVVGAVRELAGGCGSASGRTAVSLTAALGHTSGRATLAGIAAMVQLRDHDEGAAA